jgi:hypothetical protein
MKDDRVRFAVVGISTHVELVATRLGDDIPLLFSIAEILLSDRQPHSALWRVVCVSYDLDVAR